MTSIILILTINAILFWLVFAGKKQVSRNERVEKARENASGRHRWSNGQFAKRKTMADMRRELA